MLTYLQLIRRLEIPLSFRRELLKLLRLSVPEACVQLQEYAGCVLKFRKQHHAKSENYATRRILGTGIRHFSAKTPCGRTLRQNGEDCRSPGFQESAFLQRFRRKEPAGTFRLVDPALSQSLFELQKVMNAERYLVLVPLCPPVG